MIKVTKKHIISQGCKQLVLALVFIAPYSVAVTIQGTLKGNSLEWMNASYSGDYLRPSAWQPMTDLMPTTEWVPGGYLASSDAGLILTNKGFRVSIDETRVFGVSYKYQRFETGEITSGVGFPICGEGSSYSSNQVDLFGTGCIGEKTLRAEGGKTLTPFQFVRPIVKGLSSLDVVKAFEDADAPEGIYTGTMYVKPAYGFKQPVSNVWTYRYANSVPVSVSINYQPSMLSKLTVSGNGVMPALYNTMTKSISGATTYFIKAEGAFANGLRLTFKRHEFRMKNMSVEMPSDLAKTIPYNIECNLCDDKNIVVDGELQKLTGESPEGNWTLVGEAGADEVMFDLKLSYLLEKDRGDLDSISSGEFRDEFVAVFEANL